jgi:hypothetical protein
VIIQGITQKITRSSSKAIQTTQDVGYYSLGGPNLSKPCVLLHLRVPDLGVTLPTNSPSRRYPLMGVAVKHRQFPSRCTLIWSTPYASSRPLLKFPYLKMAGTALGSYKRRPSLPHSHITTKGKCSAPLQKGKRCLASA